MAMQNEKGTTMGPITVIEYSNSKLEVNRTEITRLLTQDRLRDAPIMVVSMIGAPATGKSVLLNMIMKHVTDYTNESEKMTIGIMEGFPYTQKECQTVKITIWPEPFWLKCDSREAAILFIDSEGLFDEDLSSDFTAAITTLCTLMSSIQIYNVQSNIHEVSLEKLVGHLQKGLIPLGREGDLLTQRIVFLVRDWIGGKDFRYGADGGKIYIQDKLDCSKTLSDSELLNRQFVKRAYGTVACFLMPHPGDKLADIEDFSKILSIGHCAELNPKFISTFKSFIPYLLQPFLREVEMGAKSFFTGKTWLDSFLTHAADFTEEKILGVMSSQTASDEIYNSQELKNFMDEFLQQMKQDHHLDEQGMESCLAKKEKSFKERLKGDIVMRHRFQNAFTEKMRDQIRLAVVRHEVEQASTNASYNKTCETAVNEARLRFLSRMEEIKAYSDPKVMREHFAEAKDEATEMFDKQVDECKAVSDPYRHVLENIFKKRAKMIEEEIKLAEQAKEEALLKARKAKHLAIKEYRILRDQEYGNTIPRIDEFELLLAHKRWLEAAHETYKREMNTGHSENDENISDIDRQCQGHFNSLLQRFHHDQKMHKEKLLHLKEKIKNEVVEIYLERYREELVPPENVVDSLFSSLVKCNMSMGLLQQDLDEIRELCLFEMKTVYKKYESSQKSVKHDEQEQLKLGLKYYIFDMIKVMFTDGKKLEEAHRCVTTTLVNEAAKTCNSEPSPLIPKLQKAMEKEYHNMKILQEKKNDALADYLRECENKGIKPGSVRAETITDHTAEKWFSDLPTFPDDVCNRWILRGFEALCKEQKAKWFVKTILRKK